MFKGYFTAASGMIAQQRRMDTMTNNLANMNTPGYKADQSAIRSFPEMFVQQLNKTSTLTSLNQSTTPVGSLSTGVYVQDLAPNFTQGDMHQTELRTDLALQNINLPDHANIFFTIERPDGGLQYTRNGNFTLDRLGYLTTSQGHYVLDTAGNPIQVASDDFTVNEDGWIQENGQNVAQIGIAFADNAYELVKSGEGFFTYNNGEALPSAYANGEANFVVKQSYLERSNVDPTQTMTEMLMAYRAFEANQKVLKAYDSSMDKAVNEIGKV